MSTLLTAECAMDKFRGKFTVRGSQIILSYDKELLRACIRGTDETVKQALFDFVFELIRTASSCSPDNMVRVDILCRDKIFNLLTNLRKEKYRQPLQEFVRKFNHRYTEEIIQGCNFYSNSMLPDKLGNLTNRLYENIATFVNADCRYKLKFKNMNEFK